MMGGIFGEVIFGSFEAEFRLLGGSAGEVVEKIGMRYDVGFAIRQTQAKRGKRLPVPDFFEFFRFHLRAI